MTAKTDHTTHDKFHLSGRFRFGRNWRRFLRTVDERSIREAERRLIEFLGVSSLSGQTFLDVGSGSGLHSLAARRLGADVMSFDYDPESVQATRDLRDKFGFEADKWRVEIGSVLDSEYLESLGKFDIVYSWGVLHHTGAMWEALQKVQIPVKDGGKLYIAIYNDKGEVSRWWSQRKRQYCSLPFILKPIYFVWVYTPVELKKSGLFGRSQKRRQRLPEYVRSWRNYKENRGMSGFYDMIDWIGGYPYEFAKAEDLVSFYEKSGLRLVRLARNDGTGNHELVFVKDSRP